MGNLRRLVLDVLNAAGASREQVGQALGGLGGVGGGKFLLYGNGRDVGDGEG